MMKTKLTLFVAVLVAALFGVGCASVETNSDPVKNGLAAYYPFNGNAKDESGHQLQGKPEKNVKLCKDRNGEVDRAYAFLPPAAIRLPPFKYGIYFTVSVWAKPDEKSSAPLLMISKKTGYTSKNDSMQFYLYAGTEKLAAAVHANPRSAIEAIELRPQLKNADGWTHYVFSYNGEGKRISLFRNGKLLQSEVQLLRDQAFAQFNDLNIETTIGAQNILDAEGNLTSGNEWASFKGSLDDVRIYNRELSAKEVKALYDLEKPKGK